MRLTTCAAFTVAVLSAHPAPASINHQQQQQTYPPAWGQPAQPQQTTRTHHRHHFARHPVRQRPDAPDPRLGKLVAELASVKREQVSALAALKRELADVRAQVRGHDMGPSWDMAGRLNLVGLSDPTPAPQRLASLPDLRLRAQEPAQPGPLPAAITGVPVAIEDRRLIAEATDYLIRTATPGYTMTRQGPAVAIGRLHPDFRMKLAAAIQQARAQGYPHVGIFSAYRPPIFGVGGFGDKFNSMHSYGLAVDMTGIGGPGSIAAKAWGKIAQVAGLFVPYGSDNRSEFNHTQLIPSHVAVAALRSTITANAPKDLKSMWAASGDREHVAEPESVPSQLAASARERSGSAKLLPDNVWP
jgi:hypothetical protein